MRFDYKSLSISPSISPRCPHFCGAVSSSALLPFIVAVAICIGLSMTSIAQEVMDRSERSPWRASFNQVNPQAVEAIESNVVRPPLNANPQIGSQAGAQPQSQAQSQLQSQAGSQTRPFTLPPNATSSRGTAQADTVPRLNESDSSTRPNTSNGLSTRVTRSQNQLPNAAGQVWREYDITPYTENIKSIERPQQAILDWVLRETGTEMWFNEPLGILHATKDRLIVYHTPEIQSAVKDIADRFVRTRGQEQNFNVDLLTVGNPNWRSNAYSLLQTIDVQTPGVEAWMMSKENAAILVSQLRQRSDFKQHSGGEVKSHDGQSFVLEKTKPVPFVRSIRWLPGQIPGFEPLMTTINEGYTLSISSLSLLDNRAIEVAIKCDVDQVETLTPVKIPVASVGNTIQSTDINVPELISWRLHERFRWPSDQVLLLSCGVVADPQPETSGGTGVFGLGARRKQTNRSDALLLIEYRGPATEANLPRTAGRSTLGPLK